MASRSSSRRKRGTRRGTVTVEFALVAPVVFLVFMGSIEMTQLNLTRNMANDAAYQVARRMIVPGADSSDAEADAMALLRTARIMTATIDTTVTSNEVVVAVTVPLDDNSWGLGRFIGGIDIVQTCTLARQVRSDET